MSDITLNAPALFDLSDRVALVTGAGSGIGQCIALGLAQCGASVACLDRRDDGGLDDTVQSISASGVKGLALHVDVRDRESLDDAVRQTEKELGNLGIAVNAAGIANANPAEQMKEEQFQEMMDINLKGIFLSCQAEGVISNRGLDQCHYNASKAAVIHMGKSMAMEWVSRGVRVNSISPGYTATPMNTRPEMIHQTREFESQTPMQRMASVNEMVGPAVFLASDASSYCTGVDLLVDGGFCCW